MIVRILPEVEEELYQAALWYEEREEGVGVRLLTAYDVAIFTCPAKPSSFNTSNRTVNDCLRRGFNARNRDIHGRRR